MRISKGGNVPRDREHDGIYRGQARGASVRFEECVYSFVASHVGQKPSYLQLRDCIPDHGLFLRQNVWGEEEEEEERRKEQRVEDQIIVYFMSYVL